MLAARHKQALDDIAFLWDPLAQAPPPPEEAEAEAEAEEQEQEQEEAQGAVLGESRIIVQVCAQTQRSARVHNTQGDRACAPKRSAQHSAEYTTQSAEGTALTLASARACWRGLCRKHQRVRSWR